MDHGLQNPATGASASGSKLPGSDDGRKRDNNNDHNKNKRLRLHKEAKDARKKLKAAKKELATSMEWLTNIESRIIHTREENHQLLQEMALLDALVEDMLDAIDQEDD